MSDHAVSPRLYYRVFAALIALTLTTVGADYLELGPFHTFVGLAIAVVKAALVVLFFMHVWYSSKLTWVVLSAAIFWLGVMFTLTFSDYLSRGWVANRPERAPYFSTQAPGS